ncbi:hypothetical protein [Novosphingobium album (ex Hu et al. 2023)]|uniref:DUF4148 domain-containing protein n=1 Tax=Novosphingobium album (ex Hu et al. 2023) TaxID=2930093 RepID=A0ABT0B1C4_9SPHN|nr:hypothetical protein [Novosphingobium album (ex Hu et al. 2023)]MCJ2178711.1 hypothetical protein [Novosphingobium album (ex Hu et al. 2023)]
MNTDLSRFAAPSFAIALAASVLGGCTTSSSMTYGDDLKGWGEANRQTMAAQIIDPAPQYDTAVPETSGEHVANAINRYRNDKVTRPERMKTSNMLSGRGGSGASGN